MPGPVTRLGNPQFDYLTGTNNYTRFALDPGDRSMKATFHNKNDAIIGERSYQL